MSAPEPRRGLRLQGEELAFSFDGRACRGRLGDTVASALLASGVRLFARSIKYRRPRGVLTAGPEEPNALVTLEEGGQRIPNIPASTLPLRAGMRITSQNRWPSLRYDLGALLGLGGGLFSAGFYYKTFIWPSWHAYEKLIRNLAGMGPTPVSAASDMPLIEHASCDVLVVGAGPAGIAAALGAARAGARVLVCEQDERCGGELEFESALIGGRAALEWVAASLAEIERRGGRVMTRTRIIGTQERLAIAHREAAGPARPDALYRLRAKRIVLALGAHERPIAFAGNDRPGVMLLGAAERYLARYGVKVGAAVVLFGNNDRLYASARRLREAGQRVTAIIDTRPEVGAERARCIAEDLRRSGVRCVSGAAVRAVQGGARIAAVRVVELAGREPVTTLACDTVLMSGGWSPSLHPGLQQRGAARWREESAAFVAQAPDDWRVHVGAAAGEFELRSLIASALAAGERAGSFSGELPSSPPQRANPGAEVSEADGAPHVVPFWRSPATAGEEAKQFIDFQNDVTVADLRVALAEGFTAIEHAKRYTTLGVGSDQGRVGGALGAAVLAELQGAAVAHAPPSRPRQPYHSVPLQALLEHRVGESFRPARRTPLHAWHAANGGALEPMGHWMRPRFYRANGATALAASSVEARRVRSDGGILDGSTLGKIEVAGADAAAFLDRLYLTRASTMAVGRSRYMVNLREDGMVLDDGLVLRLAPDRFLATVSSGHGGHMLSHFEFYRDTEFAGRRVALADVTEACAVIAVAGPQSRARLAAVLEPPAVSQMRELKHMQFTAVMHAGESLRVLRASFSGELAYELHCHPAQAVTLWEALIAAGLAPYGLEAVDVLRVEKGYLVGSEMNGQTTPQDLGMDALLRSGHDCVGRSLLGQAGYHEAARLRLVGVRSPSKEVFLAGAQLTQLAEARRPCGYVTSAVYSPTLDQWVGLALLAREHSNLDTMLMARDPLRAIETRVQVSPAVHYDPAGERMRA